MAIKLFELFEFIFQSPWHYLGTLLLLGLICTALGRLGVKIIRYHYRECDCDDRCDENCNHRPSK